MSAEPTHAGSWMTALLVALALAGCGSSGHRAPTPVTSAGPLRSFELMSAGSPMARDAPVWTEYGAKPLNTTLTLNAMTVYDAGRQPLELVSVRQKRPVRGLTFTSQQATLSSGFERYSEQVSRAAPAGTFGLHANFSPVRGFLINPDPGGTVGASSPSLVLTVRATRPGIFHIGDWLVTYRIGSRRFTADLVDDGEFCVGTTGCPKLG